MLSHGVRLLLGMFSASLVWSVVMAEQGLITEDELAQETVLPVFDRFQIVKNRSVVTEGGLELGLFLGSNFSEPIYNQGRYGVQVGYHWSETSAWSLQYAQWQQGRNDLYVPAISQQSTPKYDFTRIPDLSYSLWLFYEMKSYYGKISLTKSRVANLHLYPILGVGATQFTNKMYYGGALGVGQKYYLSPSLALRADFKFQYSGQPNPFLRDKLKENQPRPSPSEFQDIWRLGVILDLGLSYTF
jgi:outer membrane beta-barrel protein